MSSTIRLILVPAIITLAVTILRLVGELNGWSPTLFNSEAGGGGALVGIAWLVPIFGIYFALKLHQAGPTASAAKTLLHVVLAVVAFFVVSFGLGAILGLDPNQPTLGSLMMAVVASIVALGVVCRGSAALAKVLVAYGLAARIPVILVMLVAMLGNWGTHYDVPPPGFPEMNVFAKWFLIGVVPQLTVWMAYTVVVGALFGGLALLVASRRRSALDAA